MKNSIFLAAAMVMGSALLIVPEGLTSRAEAKPPVERPGPKSATFSELKNALKEMGFLEPTAAKANDDELTKTLKERHDSAVALLKERLSDYEKGTRDMSLIYEAGRLVAEAKLDLAADADARVKILEHTLRVAELAEAFLKQLDEKGVGSKADLERAHYASLNVKVQLLRAKQKDKPKPD